MSSLSIAPNQTTIGALIARFRESSPKSRQQRKKSDKKPDLWWADSSSPINRSFIKEKKRSKLRQVPSIDELIFEDITRIKAGLSPTKPIDILTDDEEYFPLQLQENHDDLYNSNLSAQDSLDEDIGNLVLGREMRKKKNLSPHSLQSFSSDQESPREISRVEEVSSGSIDVVSIRQVAVDIENRLKEALRDISKSEPSEYGEFSIVVPEEAKTAPLSAANIAEGLRQALGEINKKFVVSIPQIPQETAAIKDASHSEHSASESIAQDLLANTAVAGSDELNEILDRIDNAQTTKYLQEFATEQYSGKMPHTYSSFHDTIFANGNGSSLGHNETDIPLGLIQQMQSLQESVQSRMQQISKLEFEDTNSNIFSHRRLNIPEQTGANRALFAEVSNPSESEFTASIKQIKNTKEIITKDLDIALLSLRHNLRIDMKEKHEAELRKKREEELRNKASKKKQRLLEKRHREEEEAKSAKLRTMGVVDINDISELEIWRDNSKSMVSEDRMEESHDSFSSEVERRRYPIDPAQNPRLPPSIDHTLALERFDYIVRSRSTERTRAQSTWNDDENLPSMRKSNYAETIDWNVPKDLLFESSNQRKATSQSKTAEKHPDAKKGNRPGSIWHPESRSDGINLNVPSFSDVFSKSSPIESIGTTMLRNIENYRNLRQSYRKSLFGSPP